MAPRARDAQTKQLAGCKKSIRSESVENSEFGRRYALDVHESINRESPA